MASITGWGTHLPEGVLDNSELARSLDVSESWIETRTGISSRRIASPGEGTSLIATLAASEALGVAEVDPRDVDLVVVATFTADYRLPGAAPLVASALGATGAAAFDVGAGCAGFLYALAAATAMVDAGTARRAVVVGADVLSRVTDYEDPGTAILFGDGAGAVVVEAGEEHRVGPFRLHSDGTAPELLWIPPDREHMHMQGREVYRRAVDAMSRSVDEVLDVAGIAQRDAGFLVAHQANARILEAVARRLGWPPEKVVTNIARTGNTSAASIPLALAEAADSGRLEQDDPVVLTAFGAGFAWGAGVLKWGAPLARPVAVTAAGGADA